MTQYGILSQTDRSKELGVTLVRKQATLTSPRTVKSLGNGIALNYLANGITDLKKYRAALRAQQDRQPTVCNIIENEENRTENSASYLDKLTIASLELGNVTNGGLTQMGLIGMLGDTGMMKRFNVGKRNAQIAISKQLLDAYKTMPITWVNLHWYAGDMQTAQDLITVGEMIKDYTGKDLILGEVGMWKQDKAATNELLGACLALQAKYAIFYANAKHGASTGLYGDNLKGWLEWMAPLR